MQARSWQRHSRPRHCQKLGPTKLTFGR